MVNYKRKRITRNSNMYIYDCVRLFKVIISGSILKSREIPIKHIYLNHCPNVGKKKRHNG